MKFFVNVNDSRFYLLPYEACSEPSMSVNVNKGLFTDSQTHYYQYIRKRLVRIKHINIYFKNCLQISYNKENLNTEVIGSS